MDIIPFVFPGLPNVRCVFSTRGSGGGFGDGNISFAVGDNPDRVAAARSLLLQHLACEHFAELN
ncbi:MAG: laccase domain-containing protein, partial [Desulfovibrio sp.]|nr:laccase domain-containing protein [Desulfovibrio sp.]